jgi:Zn-dependent peptidase ImmA (M78 family)
VRSSLRISEPWFPIVEVLEFALPTLDEEFYMEVVDPEELGDCHAVTIPEEKLIKVRKDIYIRAHDGHGRDRGTLAHELGHLILHSRVGLARRPAPRLLDRFRNSEWQAKCFAGELLVCAKLVLPEDTPESVAVRFGVSEDSARVQLAALRRRALNARSIMQEQGGIRRTG